MFQQSTLAEAAVVAAIAVILNDRQKRRRGSVSLAIQRIVAGDTVAADEQNCEASRPMVLAAALPVQRNEPSERLHETVPETSGDPSIILGDMRRPPAWPQDIPGYRLLMADRIAAKTLLAVVQAFENCIPVNSLVDIDEAVRGMGERAELYRLLIVSAPGIIDSAGGEESLAVEARRGIAVQLFGKPLRVAPQSVDDARYVIGLHHRLTSAVSGFVDT